MSFSRRRFIATAVRRRRGGQRACRCVRVGAGRGRSSSARCSTTRATSTPTASRWCMATHAGGRGDQRRRRPARPQDPGRPVRHASPTSRSTPSTRSNWRATTRSTSCTAASPRPRARRSARPSGAPTCCTSTTCCTKAASATATASSPARRRRRRSSRSSSIAMKQWGKKVYVLAADYNYGQITAKWVAHYVKQRGGSIAADRASSRSTCPTSARPSPRSRRPSPTSVCAALVGGAHLSFFRQWAASGMNKKIPLCSTTFGVGNEHLALSRRRGRRHPDRRQLQPGRDDAGQQGLPRALGQALRRHQDRPRDRGVAVPGHQAVGRGGQEGRLARSRQADARRSKAASPIEGPAGCVKMDRQDPPRLARHQGDGGQGPEADDQAGVKQRAAERHRGSSCNLQKNPNENKQFEVTI